MTDLRPSQEKTTLSRCYYRHYSRYAAPTDRPIGLSGTRTHTPAHIPQLTLEVEQGKVELCREALRLHFDSFPLHSYEYRK